MWKSEILYSNIRLALKGEIVCRKKTPYQYIEILKTERFGNVLFLDGTIQTTEKDEFIYHEMLTHLAMLLHSCPRKVLIIGGGDGGILRETLKYAVVQEAVLVEIDEKVIELSKKYFKNICKKSFEDRRSKVIIEDGAKFIKRCSKKFDVVIIDSPDPIGKAKVLFSPRFYKDISSVLEEKGVMIRQTGSTILQGRELKKNWQILKNIFPYVWIHLISVPTYIGGFFSLTVASKGVNLLSLSPKILKQRIRKFNLKTKYYNSDLHFASAVLPEYVKEQLR